MFRRKSFEDKVTDTLMRRDFDNMQDNMIIDSMKLFRDYGIDENMLLDNLKNLKEINEVVHHYGADKTANNVEFINDKNDNLRININVDGSIGISDPYSYHVEKCEQLTELSQGIVNSLVHKEGEIGISHDNDVLSSYITHNLSKEVSTFTNSAAYYDSDDVKYNVLSDHINLLMKVDGNNLLNNYLNSNDEFFNSSNYKNLNEALSDLEVVNVRLNPNELKGETYAVNDILSIDKNQLENFNNAYCEYIGDKLKDLSKEEIDFYKEEVAVLKGMTEENLKILDEVRENYINNEKIIEELKENNKDIDFDLD